MATTTTNLSLIKPDGTDKIRINQLNQNFDILDRVVGPVGNTSLQAQVNPIAAKVTYLDKLIENGTDLNSLMNTGVYRSPNVAAGVNTLLNCPVEVPFVMVVSGTGELTGCVQLLCSGTQLYCRRATSSGFPESWSSSTGGEGGGGSESEYTIDDLYEAIDTAMAGTKAEIVSELIDDTTGEGDTDATWSSNKIATAIATMQALLDTAAHVDGEYDNFVAGNAKQLVSKVAVEDNAPYNFRTAGGAADIGDRLNDKLIGGTICWNQKIPKTTGTSGTSNGVTYTNNQDGSWTLSGTASSSTMPFKNLTTTIAGSFAFLDGHVYLTHVQYDNIAIRGIKTLNGTSTTAFTINGTGMVKAYVQAEATASFFRLQVDKSEVLDNLVVWPQVFDLTLMFGATIADYILELETANAGAGVAWFRKLFPNFYYTFDKGTLMSVQAASHNTTGFNQWDEEYETGGISQTTGENNESAYIRSKNYIPVVPGMTYYFNNGGGSISYTLRYYTFDKKYIGFETSSSTSKTFVVPNNCCYIRFVLINSTYNGGVCINLSWDGERDGEYESYVKHEYSLGNVELRGILLLNDDDELYYDGDIYEADGTVTRKYGIANLDALTWKTTYAENVYYAFCNEVNFLRDSSAKIISSKYKYGGSATSSAGVSEDKALYISFSTSDNRIFVKDSKCADLSSFVSAVTGVNMVYELAAMATESSDPFQDPQIVDDFGTEEYVDRGVTATTPTRDVEIPVGHETRYQPNLRAKLEMAPNSPSNGDGDYVVRQTAGVNEYVPIANSQAEERYARKNGEYDYLISGNAKQLVSTINVVDTDPYNFRTAGGAAEIGDRLEDKLIGGTIVWNQLVEESKKSATITPPGTQIFSGWSTGVYPEVNHVHAIHAKITYNGSKFPLRVYVTMGVPNVYAAPAIDIETAGITEVWFTGTTSTAPTSSMVIGISNPAQTNLTSEDAWSIDEVTIMDLTKMFGTAIGTDYFLSLNHANRKKWFHDLFPNSYYAYDPGSLQSINAASHNTVGFNAWDGEWINGFYHAETGLLTPLPDGTALACKNKIRVCGNTTYNFTVSTGLTFVVFEYDADGNYILRTTGISGTFTTSANTRYIAFHVANYGNAVYRNDICVNISWDGERDGELEEYVKREYPLGDVELRGLMKLDANNNLYYRGDEYESDGTVTRKFGIVDLGSLSWTKYTAGETYSQTFFSASITGIRRVAKTAQVYMLMCDKYVEVYSRSMGGSNGYGNNAMNKTICKLSDDYGSVMIQDSTYSSNTAAEFKTAMSGVMLLYELAEPTTESSDPFQDPQIVDDFGTEEYTDRAVLAGTRDVAIPVGHETKYQPNLRAKLEMAPDSPADGNGDYVVRQTNGVNEYVKLVIPNELPSVPETNGTYVLKVTVSNGTPTLSWVQST